MKTNQDDPYTIIYPSEPLPGCLAVATKLSLQSRAQELQNNKSIQHYIARAIISDHIPISGGIREIILRPQTHLLQINENPLTMYLHRGGSKVTFFDLHADSIGNVKHIDVEVESDSPAKTLSVARTEFNDLLDSIVRIVWTPLIISRLELFIKGDSEPILHELFLPFPQGVRLGPLGGIYQSSQFSTYDALIREAILTVSPYYRFLCAYRLYEGQRNLRSWLKKMAQKYSIQAKLPPDVSIDPDLLKKLNFKPEFIKGIKTVNDLHGKFTVHRDRIGHFFLKNDKVPLNFSNGKVYKEYAHGGALLLHYAHGSLEKLREYFDTNFTNISQRGSVLPFKSQRSSYIIKA